ncbi:RlmE family RNA methyltransferase [Dongia soli]|uniref:Ribosomal RNA large subunit methyltransferase E n=1 Tax=Dongia soli TaxID=600628 RepID=A0ABU5EF47_9PROT|nr:RlmE family RNA methyltransferase [Dongia soli]MDY0884088.1 RlmE family RNA methyltransferase [Dongia soli]
MSNGRRPGAGGQRGRGGSKSTLAVPTGRGVTVRVKTAAKRSVSSARWLERQLNDPYVAEAQKQGYRSRAAFKLLQLDEKFHFLKAGARVVDLGCAPGGWTQVAAAKVFKSGGGKIVGIDLLPVDPIPGAQLIEMDFMAPEAPDALKSLLDGPADVVLSDMAASATGHARTDHLKIMALAETAYDFAAEVLAPGGTFIAKVLQGGATGELLAQLKRDFAEVKHVKPPASRSDSAEIYVVALKFRGKSA